MRPISHVVVSAVTAAAFYAYSKSPWDTLACFLSGILIDTDHILDYYLHYKRMPVAFNEFYRACIDLAYNRFYLVFHSFESLVILWMLVFMLPQNILLQAITLGLTQHVVFDHIFNTKVAHNLIYFFIFRWLKEFKKEHLIVHEEKKR